MESLNLFFDEVSKQIAEYSPKGECEMRSFFNKFKENQDAIELMGKIIHGESVEPSDIDQMRDALPMSNSLIKLFEETGKQGLFDELMLPDVEIEIENECVSLLRNKLFSSSQNDRNIYASIFARELDSKLFNAFDFIDFIYEKGYETRLLESSIMDYTNAAINIFAELDIDLVEYLKKNSDFEAEFGDYNKYRNDKFVTKSEPNRKSKVEYIDVFNIVIDAKLETKNSAGHEFKKHLRRIELSDDKTAETKRTIASLDYSSSVAGIYYINSGYNAGDTYFDVRENLTNMYFNSPIFKADSNRDLSVIIREDARAFFLLFNQEIDLWHTLNAPKPNQSNQYNYSETLLGIFHGDVRTINKFLERIKDKKGVKVANEIIALREIEKIKQPNEVTNKLFFDEISNICPIGSMSSFNSAFDLGSANTKYKRTADIEAAKSAY